MGQVILYGYTENDLEKAVEKVFARVLKQRNLPNLTNPDSSDRLTQKQAAKFLGISVTSLIDWKKKGMVPYYQVGRSVFYSKKELLDIARKNHSIY